MGKCFKYKIMHEIPIDWRTNILDYHWFQLKSYRLAWFQVKWKKMIFSTISREISTWAHAIKWRSKWLWFNILRHLIIIHWSISHLFSHLKEEKSFGIQRADAIDLFILWIFIAYEIQIHWNCWQAIASGEWTTAIQYEDWICSSIRRVGMIGRFFICCLTNVMWYIRTRSRTWISISLLRSVCRSFVCLYSHSLTHSLDVVLLLRKWLICTVAPMSFLDTLNAARFIYIYFIIFAWFRVLLLILFSLSGILFCCSKRISAFRQTQITHATHFISFSLLRSRQWIQTPCSVSMQSYINAKRNFNGLCVLSFIHIQINYPLLHVVCFW